MRLVLPGAVRDVQHHEMDHQGRQPHIVGQSERDRSSRLCSGERIEKENTEKNNNGKIIDINLQE